MRPISEIIKDGGSKVEALLREAFDAGVVAGREDVRRQLEGFFSATSPLGEPEIVPAGRTIAPIVARAAPGTVKPTILQRIKDAKAIGLTTEELIEQTGFKANSVRGTVSTLQAEGMIQRMGNRWIQTESFIDSEGRRATVYKEYSVHKPQDGGELNKDGAE